MATKIAVHFTCDFCPEDKPLAKEEGDVKTVAFFSTATGQATEVDVCIQKHLGIYQRDMAKITKVLDSYLRAGRRPESSSKVIPASRMTGKRDDKSRARSRAIREWAKEEGIAVSDRGRVPNEIADKYDNRAGPQQQSAVR